MKKYSYLFFVVMICSAGALFAIYCDYRERLNVLGNQMLQDGRATTYDATEAK